MRNVTHNIVGITNYMNKKYLVCVSGLSITMHLTISDVIVVLRIIGHVHA